MKAQVETRIPSNSTLFAQLALRRHRRLWLGLKRLLAMIVVLGSVPALIWMILKLNEDLVRWRSSAHRPEGRHEWEPVHDVRHANF